MQPDPSSHNPGLRPPIPKTAYLQFTQILNYILIPSSLPPSATGTIFLLTSETPIHFLNLREKSLNVKQSRVHYLTLVIEEYKAIILIFDLAVAHWTTISIVETLLLYKIAYVVPSKLRLTPCFIVQGMSTYANIVLLIFHAQQP